ncbi:malto-oligosyltrehalose synthase [Palleronia rufa]|uniref:malto-oligosyltrehalose synthase n=1 Tax=Palleronia rufa TaxID=1530186 RepID=UPI000564F51A|nr:malto-oligosyltrehalose synthase [Palleronia rufa]
MTLPTSVYRLQFRNGMDFDRAASLVPYLARLGISHLYASPLFTAQPGSTHGYDVTDPGEIEPAIGGRDGLARLSAALRAEGLGLILDIVPNHMAFSVATPWLRDVLRHGPDSRFARHFDLDPEAGRIRLPWLTAPFEQVLAEGGFSVDRDDDGPVLVSDGLRVPLAETPALSDARSGDADAIRKLHAAQPWRLVHWRTEADALSHRRFFNVTGLVGVRVDAGDVFEDVHRLLFDLVEDGTVDGIRIDHIDGLADPAGYLDRLRARVGDTPIWVEKILSGPETLPRDWPIEGTTGYVAARAFARLLTESDGLDRIDVAYRRATGRTDPVEDVIWRARRQVLTQDLAAELWTLHGLFAKIAAADPVGIEFGPERLREALLAYIGAFPRYRSYMTQDSVSQADADLVRRTAADAATHLNDPGALPLLADVLTRADPATAPLRERMQQVTGAAVAKSHEDTAFYREVRLLSANEVGGEPDEDPLGVAGFHRAMERRAKLMPHGLSLTSSHDTKRSEDARMRIAAITREPEAYLAWFRICSGFAPERLNPNLVWYVAQTFLALDQWDGDFADRLAEHVVKALREAKSETFWTDPDTELEKAATDFVRRLASHFPRHAMEVRAIIEAADRLSLIQTALKLTVPGIPDIYQGCEVANYALTDPDNRRPVDFAALATALDDDGQLPRSLDRAKFGLIRAILHLRQSHPALFLQGGYHPIEASDGICAFERRNGGKRLQVQLEVIEGAFEKAVPAGGRVVFPTKGTPDGAPVRITLAMAGQSG